MVHLVVMTNKRGDTGAGVLACVSAETKRGAIIVVEKHFREDEKVPTNIQLDTRVLADCFNEDEAAQMYNAMIEEINKRKDAETCVDPTDV